MPINMLLNRNYTLMVLIGCLFCLASSRYSFAQSFELNTEFSTQCELDDAVGIAVADYDLDGDLDVFIVANKTFDASDPMTWSRLMRNDRELGFTDATQSSNLINWEAETRYGTMGSKLGASWGDYDNDGYPDLFLSIYGFDELWHNEGDGTFTNVSQDAGIQGCSHCYSTSGLWWDYDQDGDLDLYVSDWVKENRFFRNEGNNNFTDISEISGLNDRRHSFGALPFDLDRDGLLDIYVVNDVGPNIFHWNRGNGHFEEATFEVGLTNNGNGMGFDICDFNNDGHFDIYITNIFEYDHNPFFVNRGNNRFEDQSKQLGIDNTGWGWGARFFDADHDLDEDLYVVNGFFSPLTFYDRNKFFKFQDGLFHDETFDLGLNNPAIGMGLEVFDFDLDGDLDMMLGNRDAEVSFYKNLIDDEYDSNNWIQILLEGTVSNKNGLGAIIKITFEDQQLYRYHSGANLFSQSIKPVHFGLAHYEKLDEIEISWPSGLIETFTNSSVNEIITLTEGTGTKLIQGVDIDVNNLVFPNPFTNHIWLYLETEEETEFEFRLFDKLGKLVYKNNQFIPDTGTIELMNKSLPIPSGLYFYSIKGNTLDYNGKLFKK